MSEKTKLNKQEYAYELFNNAVSNLKAGDFAIDCGANVGKYSRMIAATGAEIVAYEPDANLMPWLEPISKHYPNFSVVNAAVGVTSGFVELLRSPTYEENVVFESKKNTIVSSALTREKGGDWHEMDNKNASTVELLDFIEILKENIETHGSISLLKLDIEGAELEILEKMYEENLFDNIDLTVAEMHGFRMPGTKDRILKLQENILEKYPREKVNFDWG